MLLPVAHPFPTPDPYFADVVSFLVPWAFWRFIAILCGRKDEPVLEHEDKPAGKESSEAASSASGEEASEARWAARSRQLRAAGGLVGVYVTWAVFAYFICAFHFCGRAARFR